jgi:hypothetical protein
MVMIGGDEQWRLEGYRVVAAGSDAYCPRTRRFSTSTKMTRTD